MVIVVGWGEDYLRLASIMKSVLASILSAILAEAGGGLQSHVRVRRVRAALKINSLAAFVSFGVAFSG